MELTEKIIEEQLNRKYDQSLHPESPYPLKLFNTKLFPAAVLIPFLKFNDEWNLLFIRRTFQKNDRHGGQVAFPGGRCDPEDPDAESTALREAFEETRILPRDVRILGRLRDMVTITGYRVTPIVGAIPWPYNLTPQQEEVDKIFTIPLPWLTNPKNRDVKNRDILVQGGASARITMLLIEALGFSSPEKRYID